jgi:hypothetical protein
VLSRAKVEVLAWLIENDDKRVSANPPGYLAESIRKSYGTPHGFETKAEHEERRRAQAAKREALMAAKAQKAAELEGAAGNDPTLRYWNSLSVQEQETLTANALAEADRWLVERFEAQREHKPHLAKDWLKVIVDRYIEKHGLLATGA